MKTFLTLLLLFPLLNVQAQELRRLHDKNQDKEEELDLDYFKNYVEEIRLSRDYYRGSNLVYDCDRKYFACVNEASWQECGQRQERAKKDKHPSKDCLQIKRLKNQKVCFKTQYQVAGKSTISKFCKRN